MDHLTYGKMCEALATSYLKRKGYNIIANNYKNTIGEIDIIAQWNNTIVFVEVKGRTSRAFGDPFESKAAQNSSSCNCLFKIQG